GDGNRSPSRWALPRPATPKPATGSHRRAPPARPQRHAATDSVLTSSPSRKTGNVRVHQTSAKGNLEPRPVPANAWSWGCASVTKTTSNLREGPMSISSRVRLVAGLLAGVALGIGANASYAQNPPLPDHPVVSVGGQTYTPRSILARNMGTNEDQTSQFP